MNALRAVSIAAALIALLAAERAAAQIPASCSELCGVSCTRPIAIPDRWDDVTAIAGYDGTLPKRPNWRNNGKFDEEMFTDTNGNGMYDPGEPYVDGNLNGKFDSEAYDPLLTGYVAGPTAGNMLAPGGDLGRSLTLGYSGASAPVPGNYQPVDLPPLNKGVPLTGSDSFLANWQGCNAAVVEPGDLLQTEAGALVAPTNQAMRDLIAQDPGAYWDPITQSVHGSAFAESPRVIHVMVYDPRTFPTPERPYVVDRKVIPSFMEQMTGNAQCVGRFLRGQTVGTTCPGASAGGWFYACATPASTTSWGRVKATYR